MPVAELQRLSQAINQGQVPIQILRQKRRDVVTARVQMDTGGRVIAKLWKYRGIKAAVLRGFNASPPQREWQALLRLSDLGVNVPAPLGYFQLTNGPARYTDALFISDLGDCQRASEYARQLFDQQQHQHLRRLEQHVIDATCTIINGGLLDIDHTMMNFLMNEDRPVRVDLEFARPVHVRHREHTLGVMLGRLIGTYGISVHGSKETLRQFRAQVFDRVRPSPEAEARSDRVAGDILSRHHEGQPPAHLRTPRRKS